MTYQQIEMHSPNGYHAIVSAVREDSSTFYACSDGFAGGKDGPKSIDGRVLETCYYDGYPNCDQFPGCNTCGHSGQGSCRPPPHGRWIGLDPNMTDARPTPLYGDPSEAPLLSLRSDNLGARAVVFTA
jgi:hypothetical protein